MSTYKDTSKIIKKYNMSMSNTLASRIHKMPTPICAPISGGNLHIVKGRDKLQDLSRVPTCIQYECNLNVLFIPF